MSCIDWFVALLAVAVFAVPAVAQMPTEEAEDFHEDRTDDEIDEFDFIGYYFTRTRTRTSRPTNEFLKGQVVGRLFGGNTTAHVG